MTKLSDYVFSFLLERGLRTVFLLPGGGAMHLVDSVGRTKGMEWIANHHEQACAIAAEACGRVRDSTGVLLVTTGPGGTNAITGVAGAWLESVPLLVVSGQVKRADLKRDSGVRQMGPQEVDIVALAQSITKYAALVEDPNDIRYHLEKALYLANEGRKGPAWIDIPLDVQAATIDPTRLRSFAPDRAGASVDFADYMASSLEQTVKLLNGAQRPLILAGHGVRLAGADASFMALYESLGIPVATTWNAADLVPADHPLSAGKPGVVALRGANFAVQNCDLLIAVGTRLDKVVTAFNHRKFARAAKKVVVDVDPAELRKLDMEVECKVCADAGEFIRGLQARASDVRKGRWSAWQERCADWRRRYPIADGRKFPEAGEISHFHFVKTLSEELPEGTLIVTGSSGMGIEVFNACFSNKRGQRILHTSALGAMGFGLPAAVGACVGGGRNPMVAIESDGSLQLNIQELATIRAHQLPIRLFVLNNAGYGSIRNTQRNYFSGRYVGTGPEASLYLPDSVRLADAYGIAATSIRDASEMTQRVREVLRSRGPMICDVRIVANEQLWPKVAAVPQPDGSMISMPMEDMSPQLPREEFKANMLVPLDPASEAIADQPKQERV